MQDNNNNFNFEGNFSGFVNQGNIGDKTYQSMTIKELDEEKQHLKGIKSYNRSKRIKKSFTFLILFLFLAGLTFIYYMLLIRGKITISEAIKDFSSVAIVVVPEAIFALFTLFSGIFTYRSFADPSSPELDASKRIKAIEHMKKMKGSR